MSGGDDVNQLRADTKLTEKIVLEEPLVRAIKCSSVSRRSEICSSIASSWIFADFQRGVASWVMSEIKANALTGQWRKREKSEPIWVVSYR